MKTGDEDEEDTEAEEEDRDEEGENNNNEILIRLIDDRIVTQMRAAHQNKTSREDASTLHIPFGRPSPSHVAPSLRPFSSLPTRVRARPLRPRVPFARAHHTRRPNGAPESVREGN